MGQWKLHSSGSQRDIMTGADINHTLDLMEHFRRRRLIPIHGPLDGSGSQYPGGKYGADDRPCAMSLTHWEFGIENILIEQCVDQCDNKEIDSHQIEESRNHSDLVDARSDRLDLSAGAQLVQRLPSARNEL